MKIEGLLLDIDTPTEDGKSTVRLTVKTKDGIVTLFDSSFLPYLYLLPRNPELSVDAISSLKFPNGTGIAEIAKVEKVKMQLLNKEVEVFKVYARNAKDIPTFKEYLQEFGTCYEYDIPFWKRYLIDKDISPMLGISAEVNKEKDRLVVENIESAQVEGIGLKHVCFDIETYNPKKVPRPKEDPVILISLANESIAKVISAKHISRDFVIEVKNERELIEKFVEIVKREDFDVIAGYNSSNFDIPYLIERSKRVGAKFELGRYAEEVSSQHHGLLELVKIPGRINIDLFNTAKFVATVGTAEYLIKVNAFTLGEVYKELIGKEKKTVNKEEIFRLYDSEGITTLAEYSLDDALSTEELYKFFMPLEIEIAKLCGTTLAETAVSTTGQLVEYLLMRYAHRNNQLIPNKPGDEEIEERLSTSFEGAYVKTPAAGIYNNLAVLDFRGLYPSIIIAHNIDPSTITDASDDAFVAPTGIKFKKEPKGIIPTVLKILIKEREGVKKEYKLHPENKALGARSQALKIIANSFYGYLGYARSRWYSKECSSSVTAYGREYIQKTIAMSEAAGFQVIYSDTDSVVLLLGNKTKDDVLAFLKQVNASLPESMELELEDFYVRGVFVGKRTGEIGAKKKYALLSESGRIKIRGFELVRRDWSNIARETQKKVLEVILKEGSKDKAVGIVKETIKNLKEGKVNIKDLVIHTQLRKGLNSYDATSPELAAAQKAIKRGKLPSELEGTTIGYVITKHGSSISEKAELEEYAQDYDADYYISHQVIPATLKILKELGVSEEELRGSGTQRRLG